MPLTPFISQKFKFYSFLAMFLLVYVHGYNLNESYLQPFSSVNEPLRITTFTEYFLANGLLRFRIPMLFGISGYLFALNDLRPYGERMKKRLRTLLVRYLIWSAVGLLITFLWQQFPVTAQAVRDAHLDQMGDNRSYVEMGWKAMISRWLFSPISFQLWFIRVLLVYNALYPVFRWLVLKVPVPWFIIASLLWISTAGFYFVEGEGMLFFTLGIWICKSGKSLEEAPKWFPVKLYWLLFLLLTITKTILAFYLTPCASSFVILSLLHKAVVFTGLVSFWYGAEGLVKRLMSLKWFTWQSGFSFTIYALHVPLVNYCTKLIFRYSSNLPCYRIITYLLLPLLIIGFCILTGWIFRSLVPRAYSVATGGRGL